MGLLKASANLQSVCSQKTTTLTLHLTMFVMIVMVYIACSLLNGHALYNVVDKMEVKSIPVQAKANNRISGTYDLDIKDPKLLKDVNHALEKYHKRKIEDKSMALNKIEYMNKCYPDLGIP